MQPVRQKRIRELLRQHPDGLTPLKLAGMTGLHVSNIRTALRAMPDVYVDRWIKGKRGQYEKVWCAVHVPENCPHPKDKVYKGGRGFAPKTHWQPMGMMQ